MSQHPSRADEIVATTLDLAEDHGVAKLTTAALARRLNFTEAALYRYFPSKDSILSAALQRTAETLFASMAVDLDPSPGSQAGEVEARLRHHIRRFCERQGTLLELVLAASTVRSGELQEAGNAFLQEYYQRMAVCFEQLRECGLISGPAPVAELTSLWTCQLLGGFVRCRLTNEPWDPEAQEGFRAFLHRLQTSRTASSA